MQKSKLEKFITKYNLGGSCESVIFKSDGMNLSVRAISDDKNVLGEVTVQDINFPEGEFGVYDTKKLRSILGVLDDTLTIGLNKKSVNDTPTSLNITDGNTRATFVLADPSVIPPVPELKKLPPMDFTINLDQKFIQTFIKAKSALNEVETFAIMSSGEDNTVSVVIGHSNTNTNRITITASTDKVCRLSPINFSANYLREILTANKDNPNGGTATLQVSSKGIALVQLDSPDFKVSYYLVQIAI